uniref:Uncharacterized protein n=1 Tax=Schistocephalus solidus TaxID=70667 RepID=A0A0X3PBY0_SCHSO
MTAKVLVGMSDYKVTVYVLCKGHVFNLYRGAPIIVPLYEDGGYILPGETGTSEEASSSTLSQVMGSSVNPECQANEALVKCRLALAEQLRRSLIPLCLGAHSQAMQAVAEWLVIWAKWYN